MGEQIVFSVGSEVIELAILELPVDGLEGDIVLGCNQQSVLILSHIEVCKFHLLHKFLLSDGKLFDFGHLLEILSLDSDKVLKFFPGHNIKQRVNFVDIEEDFKQDSGLTLSNSGIFGHKLPEFQVVPATIIEEVKQPSYGLLK